MRFERVILRMRDCYFLLVLYVNVYFLSPVLCQNNGKYQEPNKRKAYIALAQLLIFKTQFFMGYQYCLVIIITGGYSDEPNTSRSAEIWAPEGVGCVLPDLEPEARYLHTQDGNQACGGGHQWEGWHTCSKFSDGLWRPSSDLWWQKWGHTSWVTEEGTYLMAGGKSGPSILVRPGGEAKQAFSMAETVK